VERGVRNASFARELLKSEIAAPFSKERGQLLRQSFLCHDRILQLTKSHKWDNLLVRLIFEL